MADDCEISVVTPAYNPGADLFSVVETLNGQTFRHFEWVLIDDCSDPSQAQYFEKAQVQADFPIVSARHAQNAGQAQARNTGVSRSSGGLVKFLDADDLLDAKHLENLFHATRSSSEEKLIFFAPTKHYFADEQTSIVNTSYERTGVSSEEQLAQLLIAPFLHHCGALFPRKLLVALGPFDTSLKTDEDGDLLIRTLLEGWRFSAVPESFYIYCHRGVRTRVSRDDTLAKIEARRRVCEKLIDRYVAQDERIPDRIGAALCKRLDAIAVKNWSRHRRSCEELLNLASAIDARYSWSGSRGEQLLRRLVGIGAAAKVAKLSRRVRGVALG